MAILRVLVVEVTAVVLGVVPAFVVHRYLAKRADPAGQVPAKR